nr:ATP-binding cassette domain-containing protein [Marinicella sp. W31]MDC2875608.1 ATP-binding cassette domain-containing protein [Marinicella sp. W31]
MRTPAADRGVSMVFQSYALYPHMTVRQNLSFGLENIGMPKAEIEKRIQEASTLLQIDELLNRRPTQLSGGQRQRVAIGRSIVREPKIFLFDEPLSNLDAELRVVMRFEINALHERLGNTMIYVTHDQIEAMTMADKIVVLRKGNIEQVGAPLELYNHPNNKFVAGFIGSPRMNFLKGRITRVGGGELTFGSPKLGNITLAVPQLPVKESQEVSLGIRPEDLEVVDGDGWRFTVSIAEQHGRDTYLHGRLEDGTEVLLHKPGQFETQRGDVLVVRPRQGAWHLFDTDEQAIR